jgi:hypothetical protein
LICILNTCGQFSKVFKHLDWEDVAATTGSGEGFIFLHSERRGHEVTAGEKEVRGG